MQLINYIEFYNKYWMIGGKHPPPLRDWEIDLLYSFGYKPTTIMRNISEEARQDHSVKVGDYIVFNNNRGRVREILHSGDNTLVGYLTETSGFFPVEGTQKLTGEHTPISWTNKAASAQPLVFEQDSAALRAELIKMVSRTRSHTSAQDIISDAEKLLNWINQRFPSVL